MTHYVVGFAFSSNCERVVLIQKNRPKWQAGKLNGVGGHIEVGEESFEAMVREYREETGIHSSTLDWSAFAYLRGADFDLQCYAAFNDSLLDVETRTDEVVSTFPVTPLLLSSAPLNVIGLIPNLTWLIPLAIDCHRETQYLFVEAKYAA